MWSFDAIADAIAHELERRDRALREEQAVRGLDSLDELELHPMVEAAFRAAGFGVLREQPYPHEWRRKAGAAPLAADSALPEHRDRMRCDFVLTERSGQRLDDTWASEREERARLREVKGSLFEDVAGSAFAPAADPLLIQPEDALWLEVKTVTQFDCASGAAGPNRGYAGQLVRGPVADLAKLADDPRVHHAAVAIVAFTCDAGVATHDLTVLAHKCLDRDLPVVSPATRSFPVPDRMGNGSCTVCVVGMRKVV